jgi:hypothetical protein
VRIENHPGVIVGRVDAMQAIDQFSVKVWSFLGVMLRDIGPALW